MSTNDEQAGPLCSVCRKPATCFGRSTGDNGDSYACDDCCGHYCADAYGQCEELPGAEATREQEDLLREGDMADAAAAALAADDKAAQS